jgi:DNA-binding GntR family transcriptional regulator
MQKNVRVRQIERPASLAKMASDQLRQAIMSGDFNLGEPLTEIGLAAALGISKTPIREALSVLKTEGLVTVIPQKGTFVFTLSSKDVADICELRYALESTALRLAFERDREAFVESLHKVCERMVRARKNGDQREYLKLDMDYHVQILEHCGNQYLADTYDFIHGKVAALRTHLARHPAHTEKSFAEHKSIADAISEGNLAKALKILEKHVTRAIRTYAETIVDIAAADRELFPNAASKSKTLPVSSS